MPCSAAFAAEYNAALVADMNTGQILFKDKADDLNYPASLTKIMTLYLTFDALDHGRLHLEDLLIVSNAAANASPVKLGLVAGSKISVEDAIKAVAVISANDVARVLAENLKGGKEGNFASLMTQVATEIGLSRTNFENSSGLPDDDHLSSARDIALLSLAVYQHYPQYWKYFGIKSWTYNGKTHANGNRLLGSYPGCDGMKTGYTNKSKYSLVSTAQRDGRHIMVVVLGAPDKDVRADVSRRLLDRGFATAGGNVPINVVGEERRANISSEMEINSYGNSEPSVFVSSSASRSSISVDGKVAAGKSGVQFGAFSSRGAAGTQQSRVLSALGIQTNIEIAPNGLFRVRANGLSESAAQNAASRAKASGIDCYVFH